jgi:hypothetical protein
MAKGYNLGDLRAAIDDTNQTVISENGIGEAHNTDVLRRLKSDRPDLLVVFTPQLVDIALTKLLNEVANRKNRRKLKGSQIDLFEGYSGIPGQLTITKGVKKPTEKCTLVELQDYLSSHSKRLADHGNEGLQKLFDECRKDAKSETETVEEIRNRQLASVAVQKELIPAD